MLLLRTHLPYGTKDFGLSVKIVNRIHASDWFVLKMLANNFTPEVGTFSVPKVMLLPM